MIRLAMVYLSYGIDESHPGIHPELVSPIMNCILTVNDFGHVLKGKNPLVSHEEGNLDVHCCSLSADCS